MDKYVGVYRVLHEIDVNGNVTKNEDATYLLGKYHIECYRYNENTLALYFPSGKNATNIILPQFDNLGIIYKLHIDGDYESIYLVSEKDLDKIHSVVKFQTKGKNIKPTSVKTARKLFK